MLRPPARPAPAPQQARSRKTMERLLDTAEAFLEQSLFDQVAIAEIARQAGVSVGNLYNRFPDKAALLEEVYTRREQVLDGWFAERLSAERWRDRPLSERVPGLVDALVRHYAARPGLTRSFVMYYRTYGRRETREMRAGAKTIYQRMVDLLLERRDEIRHPDPPAAVRTGIFVVMAACRDRLLFGDDPMASAMRTNQTAFRRELSRLLASYLGLEAPPPPPRVRRARPRARKPR